MPLLPGYHVSTKKGTGHCLEIKIYLMIERRICRSRRKFKNMNNFN